MSKGQGKGGQSIYWLSRWYHENVETEVLEGMRGGNKVIKKPKCIKLRLLKDLQLLVMMRGSW